MRVLLIIDPGITVPPLKYGGHERLVYMMAMEYRSRGHEVDILATRGSKVVGCKVISIGCQGYPPRFITKYLALIKVWLYLFFKGGKYELIHNFGRLLFILPVIRSKATKIMTYGREIVSRNIYYFNKLPTRNIVFTAASDWCVSTGNVSGKWITVYNCIEFNKYDLNVEKSDSKPLIFLSRLDRIKGAYDAIVVAKILGLKLIIAGNISNSQEEQDYFESVIKPEVDNIQICYVGSVNDEQKNMYLGASSVLLFPARTREAFGMVMIEAMACGTPVIAYNHSAMPEVIRHGETGFIVDDIEGMIDKVVAAQRLDRSRVRSIALQRFDSSVISSEYLKLIANND
jgi:glycosyltransferase involved in cell wall biosynthesis